MYSVYVSTVYNIYIYALTGRAPFETLHIF